MAGEIGKDKQEQRYWTCVELIKDLKETNKVARASLTYLVLIGVLVMITLFNSYLGWFKNYNYKDRPEYTLSKYLTPEGEILEEKYLNTVFAKAEEFKPGFDKTKEWKKFIQYIHQNGKISSMDTLILWNNIPFEVNYDIKYNSYKRTLKKFARYSNTYNTTRLAEFLSRRDTIGITLNTEAQTRSMIESNIRAYKFTIPLLGLEANVGDIGLIAGILVLLLYTWYHFQLIRENSIILEIKKVTLDMLNYNPIETLLSYERIRFIVKRTIHSFVFVTTSDSHYYSQQDVKEKMKKNEMQKILSKKLSHENTVINTLTVIPILALSIVWIVDLVSIFILNHYPEFMISVCWRMLLSSALILINYIIWRLIVGIALKTSKIQYDLFEIYAIAHSEAKDVDPNIHNPELLNKYNKLYLLEEN